MVKKRKKARNNPLLKYPPVPEHGRQHKLGDKYVDELGNLFGDVDEGAWDIHAGVHITPYMIVATYYALGRRVIDDAAFAMPMVTDPAILLGFKIKDGEHLDADGYATASRLLDVAEQANEENWDFSDLNEDAQEILRDYTCFPIEAFDSDMGLKVLGGSIGNLPDLQDFTEGVEELSKDPDNRLLAMQIAHKILPQSRLLRDVDASELTAVFVLPPYAPVDGEEWHEEVEGNEFFLDAEDFEGRGSVKELDNVLKRAGLFLGNFNKANRWHGTSLSVAREAFPDIFNAELCEEAINEGDGGARIMRVS